MNRDLGELVTMLQLPGHRSMALIGPFAGTVVLAKVKRLDDRKGEYWV